MHPLVLTQFMDFGGADDKSQTRESIEGENVSDTSSTKFSIHHTVANRSMHANDINNCFDAKVFFLRQQSRERHEIPPPPTSPSGAHLVEHATQTEEHKHYHKHMKASDFIAFGKYQGHGCKYGRIKEADVFRNLDENDDPSANCICACSDQSPNSYVYGWETPKVKLKQKTVKKATKMKASRSSESFTRLTATADKSGSGAAGGGVGEEEYFEFQHFKNWRNYMEQYRLTNTVGCAFRRTLVERPVEKPPAEAQDPYINKIKSTIWPYEPYGTRRPFCAIAENCDLLAILSGETKAGTPTSDEYWPGNDGEALSMKDRGKELNLAPVRETLGTDTYPYDRNTRKHYLTLNQYLNLVIPKAKLPPNANQPNFDDPRESTTASSKFRIVNTGDNNLFPATTPRRGARPLRLGSAEFVKPGTPESIKLVGSAEGRKMQRASTFHHSTVPGTLYVGSTVAKDPLQSEPPPSPPRTTKGPTVTRGKTVVPNMKHKCDRVAELSAKSATSKENDDDNGKTDFNPRGHDRTITLDVNQLGIRGRMFKADELSIVYKFQKERGRRIAVATVKS